MAERGNIGRVVVDVDFNDKGVRSKLETTFAKPFDVKLRVNNSTLNGLRGQINAALAKPFVVRVVVDEKGVAQVVNGVQRNVDRITAIEKAGYEQRRTNRERFFQQQRTIETRFEQQRLTNSRRQDERIALAEAQAEERRLRLQEQYRLRSLHAEEQHARAIERLRLRSGGFASLEQSVVRFSNVTGRALATSALAFTGWSTAVTAAVGVAATAGVVAFAKLEEASTNAAVVVATQLRVEELNKYGKAVTDFADQTESARKRIEESAQRIALETRFDPTEISEGIGTLLKSGQDAESALKNIGAAAQFASVNGADLTETSEGLAKALASAGLDANQSALLLDKISLTAAQAVGDVEDYFDAFANGAAAAGRIIGATTDETLFVLRLLGQAGTLGLEAGTQVDIIFRDLGRAATKSRKEWEEYGLTANGTVTDQLVLLAELIEKTGTNRQAQAKLRAELGLQEKSFRAISRIIPQIQNLGPDSAARSAAVQREIGNTARNSIGLVEMQLKEQRKTIAFQYDALTDSLKIALQELGRGAGAEVAKLFDDLGGAGGIVEGLIPKFQSFGRRVGSVVRELGEFLASPAFANGLNTLGEAVRVTVEGFRDAFAEFGNAFAGAENGKTAFEGFAAAILAFSRAAAATLPQIARVLGEIFNFLNENSEAVKAFVTASVALFAVRKAWTLLIAPIIAVGGAIRAATVAMMGFGAVGATGAMSRLAAPVLALSAAFGRLALPLAAAYPAFATLTMVIARIVAPIAVVTAAISVAIGFFRGFADEISRGFAPGTPGGDALRELSPLFEAIATGARIVGGALMDMGELAGRGAAALIIELVEAVAALWNFVTLDWDDASFTGWIDKITIGLPTTNLALKLLRGRTEDAGEAAERSSFGMDLLAASIERVRGAMGSLGGAGAELGIGAANEGREDRAEQVEARYEQATGRLARANAALSAAQSTTGQTADDSANALDRVRSAADGAAAAVRRMTEGARERAANSLVRSIGRVGESFRLSRTGILLLEQAMPNFDKALDKSRDKVKALDDQLSALRETQLEGTKAFSDTAFALDQQAKALQLQRVDLKISGAADEDPRIAALDAQLAALQLQTERNSLSESLTLDPQRRQLDQTLNPTSELPLQELLNRFATISAQQERQSAAVARQEQLQKTLNAALENSKRRFDEIDASAQSAADAVGSIGAQARASTTSLSLLRTEREKALRDVRRLTLLREQMKAEREEVPKAVAGLSQNAGTAARGFANGLRAGYRNSVLPAVRAARTGIETALQPTLGTNGSAAMDGFEAGMKAKMGDKSNKKPGTIAHYLNVVVPGLIRELKGPVAYDATILVPAGEAIMDGLDRGLRRGFGGVADYLRDVGPSMEEFVPEDMFAKRTASFLVDVAMGKNPDVEKAFGDLVPETLGGDFAGILDPSLGFLHKTLSLADTTRMAQHLAKLFGLSITSTDRAAGTLTSSGNISDHTFGTAADISGSMSNTDRMMAALKPYFGTIFKQLIWRDRDINRGYYIPNHMNHAHVAWLMGAGFNKYSGKIGKPSLIDIPGAPNIVDRALNEAAAKTGVSLGLLAAIAKQESGFRPGAKSPAGAGGLMQLMPATAASLGVTDRFDPFQSALGGAKYIKQMLSMFGGNTTLALAGYNAGPGNARLALTSFGETIEYVRKVMGFLRNFGGFREAGGPVSLGRNYIVGERGPELFVPRQSGTIIPAGPTASMMSGGRQVVYEDRREQHFHSNATDPRTVAAIMDAHARSRIESVNMR